MSADLPPDDRAPDFPPGPTGPEDSQPGPAFTLSRDQLEGLMRYLSDDVGRFSAVRIEERGAAYFDVEVFDAEGNVIGERTLFPTGN